MAPWGFPWDDDPWVPGALAEALHGIPAVACAQRTATGGGGVKCGMGISSGNGVTVSNC